MNTVFLEVSRHIAKTISDKYEVGISSRFCDDMPDFDAASIDEIAGLIAPSLTIFAAAIRNGKEPMFCFGRDDLVAECPMDFATCKETRVCNCTPEKRDEK